MHALFRGVQLVLHSAARRPPGSGGRAFSTSVVAAAGATIFRRLAGGRWGERTKVAYTVSAPAFVTLRTRLSLLAGLKESALA